MTSQCTISVLLALRHHPFGAGCHLRAAACWKPRSFVLFLKRTLDQGESEAISLAVNRHAEILLIDEREGRETARGLGLRLTGTLGILMRAKLDGSLNSLGETLEKLRQISHFRSHLS